LLGYIDQWLSVFLAGSQKCRFGGGWRDTEFGNQQAHGAVE
jgi:hypothetical protein